MHPYQAYYITTGENVTASRLAWYCEKPAAHQGTKDTGA